MENARKSSAGIMDQDAAYSSLRDWLLRLPGVSEAPHRFGGTQFQISGLEFMHFHGPSFLDIRLSLDDQSKILKEKKALPHRFAPQAGWVGFRIENPADAESAKAIIQLAYDNAKTTRESHRRD